jgi:ribosomal protein S12 methylthiotransferase
MQAIPTVAFVTLGCPKNEVDTDLMRAAVEEAGYYSCEYLSEQTEDSKQTESVDAIVVNTCSFIQEATEASIEAIFDALESSPSFASFAISTTSDTEKSPLLPSKADNKQCPKTKSTTISKPPVIVAGCIVNRYADNLAEEMPEIAAFIKVGDTEALVNALAKCLPVSSPTPIQRQKSKVRSFEYLRIADGCDRKCSFCTIPNIRGAYTSREPQDILKQARQLVAAGTLELIVIAQDISRYGTDLDADTDLIKLLNQLAAIPKLKRLRLMYLQPEGLSDELIKTMAQHPSIVPYLEIPLQHIAPRILKAMGRSPRAVEKFEQQLAKARKLMPELSVRTTLIAGFPGETAEEFDQLCSFVERANLDYVGVFPYSPEEGTVAAELPCQLDDETRLGRAQRLRDLADNSGWQRAAERIGQRVEVLIEGHDLDEGTLVGRAAFQTPDIDGIVRIAVPEAVPVEEFFSAHKSNTYLEVEFTDAILYDMDGTIIPPDKDEGRDSEACEKPTAT